MSTIPLIPAEQLERQRTREASDCPELWALLDQVKDPEVPVLSLWDLGVLRNIECDPADAGGEGASKITVTITPTYSGCPAMETMRTDIQHTLQDAGYTHYEVKTRLAPAWTAQWMTPEGRSKLRNYGIAPPEDDASEQGAVCASGLTPEKNIICPHCRSTDTVRISEFGSTACKALFQCNDCSEPFDYFKNI